MKCRGILSSANQAPEKKFVEETEEENSVGYRLAEIVGIVETVPS